MQNSCPTEVKIEDQNGECLKLNWYRKAHTDKNLLIKKFCARHQALALQLPFPQVSESMGNHDSKIVGAASVD
jgi:hypothetical protein